MMGLLAQICSTNPMQSVERTFQLTRADKDLLSKQEYDVQVGASYGDSVPVNS